MYTEYVSAVISRYFKQNTKTPLTTKPILFVCLHKEQLTISGYVQYSADETDEATGRPIFLVYLITIQFY